MKKCFLIIGFLSGILMSSVLAQNCNCMLLLEEANKETQQYFDDKQIPTEIDRINLIYEKFKHIAKLPHSQDDCRELIIDYLEIFEDANMTKRIKVSFKQKNKHL